MNHVLSVGIASIWLSTGRTGRGPILVLVKRRNALKRLTGGHFNHE